MNDRIKNALYGILEKFQSGEIPEVIAIATFPPKNIPAARWSLMNRMLMYISGTKDARGFHQWLAVNRRVRKGAKANTIFAPRMVKQEINGREEMVLHGFLAVPVFKVEDTEGEPLDYEWQRLPALPLHEVAKSWGITVKAIPGNDRYLGCYRPERGQIELASKDESIFFHELAHAAHDRIGGLSEEDSPLEEIVAELSAQALCCIVGKTSRHLGNSYQYIDRQARKLDMSPLTACAQVLGEVEKVLNLILSLAGTLKPDQEAAPVLLTDGLREAL
jgi:hypothetical protein